MQDVHQQYKVLQEEFKETHRTVDRLVRRGPTTKHANQTGCTQHHHSPPSSLQRGNNFNPGELKREITQLEEEKLQLTEKISTLKRKTTGVVRAPTHPLSPRIPSTKQQATNSITSLATTTTTNTTPFAPAHLETGWL